MNRQSFERGLGIIILVLAGAEFISYYADRAMSQVFLALMLVFLVPFILLHWWRRMQ